MNIDDFDSLTDYLKRKEYIGSNESISARKLTGGVSCRAIWVDLSSGESWVIKQALEKLRVDVDWFSDPTRIHREAAGMRALQKLAPTGTITPLIFEDLENHILAMKAVEQPHENWKDLLLEGEILDRHVVQFATLLGSIHRGASADKVALENAFSDCSFFESLRMEPYYAYTAQQVSEAASFLNTLIEDTRTFRWTLVHGDYSPKNILIHKDRLILLDHEVIHFGDGAFDLGFALTHFLSKAGHVKGKQEAFKYAALRFWKTYTETLGLIPEGLEERAIRHTLGCMLARVAGRSCLEYLSLEQRARQQTAVLKCIQDTPKQMTIAVEEITDAL